MITCSGGYGLRVYQSSGGSNFATPTWSVTYGGAVRARNVVLDLEPENPDNYELVTEEYTEREVNNYIGPTLDVKERLLKANAALLALKEAASAATDFASLQAAMITALADI